MHVRVRVRVDGNNIYTSPNDKFVYKGSFLTFDNSVYINSDHDLYSVTCLKIMDVKMYRFTHKYDANI